jgi:hypothetical protein
MLIFLGPSSVRRLCNLRYRRIQNRSRAKKTLGLITGNQSSWFLTELASFVGHIESVVEDEEIQVGQATCGKF